MAKERPPEILPAGSVLTSRELKTRFRLGEASWRKLKREGLATHQIGKTVVVLADDFHEFLRSRDKESA